LLGGVAFPKIPDGLPLTYFLGSSLGSIPSDREVRQKTRVKGSVGGGSSTFSSGCSDDFFLICLHALR